MARKNQKSMCTGKECIFCNSKCPECGSINVTVTYRPCYQYTNDEKDRLILSRQEDRIELECEECGEQSSSEWEEDPRLDNLMIALGRALNLASEVECKHRRNGEIEVKHYEWQSVEPKGGDR